MPVEPTGTSDPTHAPRAPLAGTPPLAGTVVADAATLACDRLLRVFGQALQLAHADSRDQPMTLPLIEFSRGLLQMRVRPALSTAWPKRDPVHIVMFGGTNSGKSTVVNLLLGRPAAAMNPTARFSQHPVAFIPTGPVDDSFVETFPSRFRDYRRFVNQTPPRQTDADLRSAGYKPALGVIRLDDTGAPVIEQPATTDAIFWDAPDFSTEEARYYIRAVLDAVAMADVVVLCVTGESYANDLVAKLLRMVAGTGVSIHVAANKLSEKLEPLTDIIAKLRQGDGSNLLQIDSTHVHPLMVVPGEDVAARLRALATTPQARNLRESIAREATSGPTLKRAILGSTIRFLGDNLDTVLKPLVDEANLAQQWATLVRGQARLVLSDRYRSDYINGSRYGEFNQTLMRVLEQLDVPYVGQTLRAARSVIRKPMTWAMDFIRGKLLARKPVVPPEEDILGELIKQWFTKLRGEVQAIASTSRNNTWFELDRKLADVDLRSQILDGFAAGYVEYRDQLDEQERARARNCSRPSKSGPC
ncbi:MAG: hypothetical protein QM770_16630 [Tepidisphaeraceae bacterium]